MMSDIIDQKEPTDASLQGEACEMGRTVDSDGSSVVNECIQQQANDTSKMSEHRKSIGELLDGRTFIIPPYQRGYRWKKQQVKELVDDLVEFASKSEGKFYLLQLVVVKRIEGDNTYEVIDGQQRLTTIFLILRYLQGSPPNMSIEYATREKLKDRLREPESGREETIDEWYIKNAYTEIKRLLDGQDKEEERRLLEDILTAKKESERKHVDVLWQDIAEDKEDKDTIKTFRTTNSGKIWLEESELIKSVFLREKKDQSHFVRAVEWENIENKFQDNAFWGFLTNEKSVVGNARRINTIARLMHSSDDDAQQQNVRDNELFNYIGTCLARDQEKYTWDRFIATFRILEDWYNDTRLYNYIGLCSQTGIKNIEEIYKLCKNHWKNDFVEELKKSIYEYLVSRKDVNGEKTRDIDRDIDNVRSLEYPRESEKIKNVLLAYNVQLLNSQLENMEKKEKENAKKEGTSGTNRKLTNKNLSMYKFPFDVYKGMKWHLEHISSREEKWKVWASDVFDYYKKHLDARLSRDTDEWNELEELINNIPDDKREEIEKLMKKLTGEELLPEEKLNFIGNLALLDETTNKSYKNKPFREKKNIIRKNINEGCFIMPGTQRAFFKLLDISDNERGGLQYWNEDDAEAQAESIIGEIKKLNTKH